MELTRTSYAMARQGALPRSLASVSASGTPRAALMVGLEAIILIIAAADRVHGQSYESFWTFMRPSSC